MPYYRKKPIVIEAFQFFASDPIFFGWPGWANDAYAEGRFVSTSHRDDSGKYMPTLTVLTLEGRMIASDGDWIIKGVKGELYPCKPDVFAKTYEEINQPDPSVISLGG